MVNFKCAFYTNSPLTNKDGKPNPSLQVLYITTQFKTPSKEGVLVLPCYAEFSW